MKTAKNFYFIILQFSTKFFCPSKNINFLRASSACAITPAPPEKLVLVPFSAPPKPKESFWVLPRISNKSIKLSIILRVMNNNYRFSGVK